MVLSKVPNQGIADAGLRALGDFNSNGIIVQTADNTFVSRTLVQPAAGIQVTNSDGVSGNLTLGLANDLLALESLSGTGIPVRTSTDIWAQRTITGTTNSVVLTNGNGVSGNPTIDLAPRLGTVAVATTDWNTTEYNGWYRSSSNTTDLNAPTTGWFIGMHVGEGASPNAASQIVWDQTVGVISDTKMWRRTRLSGVWTAWMKVKFTEVEQGTLTERTVAGTSDTLVLTDVNRFVRTTSGSATTVTVPLNSTVAFPIGSLVYVEQYGAGQVTFAAAGGVTIRSVGSRLKLFAQYSGAYIRKIGTDEWMLIGDLVP